MNVKKIYNFVLKYKLINKITGEEHICEKVVIGGWDYYVSGEPINDGERGISINNAIYTHSEHLGSDYGKKLIATNNRNLDIPKVVEEVERFENEYFKNTSWGSVNPIGHYEALRAGYNKSQETHPNSDDDMAEFAEWLTLNTNSTSIHGEYIYKNVRRVTKELIQIWKEQRTKILYYL